MAVPVPNNNIKYAFVNASSSGNNQLVAAPGAGLKIRVLSLVAVCGVAATSMKLQSATTDISALFAFAANGGMVLNENASGWFSTAAGEALNVNLSGANPVGVSITYISTTV
jgi:hypothetical protein